MSDTSSEDGQTVPVFSYRRLTYLEELGEGAFGTVYKANLQTGSRKHPSSEIVAVKELNEKGTEDDVWEECRRMIDLEHPNVLRLIGMSTSRGEEISVIIMEYMQGQDLHSYILNYPGGSMTAFEMVTYAYGIACGMEYLHHEIFPYVRHGDLAARNCLVGPNYTIKIGDFGKYLDYPDQYYQNNVLLPCPIRWMAPENVPTAYQPTPKTTRKGDIWAYGVVLYEIWTRGSEPYGDLEIPQILQALAHAENPETYYYGHLDARRYVLDLMEECWEFDPLDRPNFKEIKQRFEDNDSEIVN